MEIFFITGKNFFNIVEGNFISQYLLTHLLQCPLMFQGIFVWQTSTNFPSSNCFVSLFLVRTCSPL